MQQLSTKIYTNEFVTKFPGDESGELRSRQTPGMLYSKAVPTPVKSPALLGWSDELARELGIQTPDEKDIAVLAGNLVTPSMYPYAACYAGHQFGNWAGQLGDGRAINLGTWETEEGQSWELQLKGAGPTAYSRRADGRAVLRSSVREYLMSEAMHYLGVPTTRALSLVTTGEPVLRDMFYDGHPAYEPGAIVMRVAPTFLRFGNFELLAARGETNLLRQLTNWTIERYYPHIKAEEKVVPWFTEVVARTAKLMTEWLRVGFVHGVMNTDNMSILALTIDYGPYSFVDEYDPNFTPNTTDLPGRRYAFGKQAAVAKWNLGCLAGALAPLLPDTKGLESALETYDDAYWHHYYTMMGNKLGLDAVRAEDATLIQQTVQTLTAIKPDMTLFFQRLMELPAGIENEQGLMNHFSNSLYYPLHADHQKILLDFISLYSKRITTNTCTREEAVERMRKANPRFILRNYLLHQAIEELQNGEQTLFKKLQQALKDPYSANFDEFLAKRPDWASQKAGCSMLSCSS